MSFAQFKRRVVQLLQDLGIVQRITHQSQKFGRINDRKLKYLSCQNSNFLLASLILNMDFLHNILYLIWVLKILLTLRIQRLILLN